MTDRVPPTKRPRLAATPSSVSSTSSTLFTTSSNSTAVDDIDSARRASTLRVLSVWNQLAERYSRRLDEDDIVDLFSGTIIKDCGILKRARRDFKLGLLAKTDVEESNSDYDNAQTEVDSERSQGGDTDDVDSPGPFRGTLAAATGISDQLKAYSLKDLHSLSATTDADDLSEFLEAERLRRKREELAEGKGEVEMSLEDLARLRKALKEAPPRKKTKAQSAVEQVDVTQEAKSQESDLRVNLPEESQGATTDRIEDVSRARVTSRPPRTSPPHMRFQDDESEDELGTWGNDEFNAVYIVSKARETNTSESEREVIILSDSDSDASEPSSGRPPETPSRARFSLLPSPPSRAKSKAAPNTPKEPRSTKAKRAKSKTPYRYRHASRSLPLASDSRITFSPKRPLCIQLHTPPRSSSAAADNTITHEESLDAPDARSSEREKSTIGESDEEFEELLRGPPWRGGRVQTPGLSIGRARLSRLPSPSRMGRSKLVPQRD